MLKALSCHLSQKRLGCDQEEDACNRGKGSLLTLQGTSEQKNRDRKVLYTGEDAAKSEARPLYRHGNGLPHISSR